MDRCFMVQAPIFNFISLAVKRELLLAPSRGEDWPLYLTARLRSAIMLLIEPLDPWGHRKNELM